ncbi:non-ribosomal peptide synthase/polyketide synthase [Bosea sp. (in: a-proteobacteria)]|uniref:non-ribosomal peptide synthase/polyketide synthase n=1 Tax=Bosea sp. (in: a-proteobacteria) TaxID=1871050 RepID=UPI0031FE4CBF
MAGRAARLLCELTGCERAAFVNSGSEAVITAVRLARTRTGRSKIAVFEGGYHGFQDEALVSAVADGAGGLRSMIMVPGIPPQVADNVMVLEYCSERSLEILRATAGELAAVLLEPQQSRRAGGFDPGEFLRRLREITEQAGTALILDEVITGFRIHPGGAQAVYGVRADLVTYGKGIGAGVPAAAVAGRAEYLDGLDGGSWSYGDDSYPQAESTYIAGTYFKHPLIMAAVWTVLDHFKTAGAALQQGMTERAERLAKAVNDLCEQEQVPIRMLQWGSICNFLFAPEMKHPAVFYGHLLDNGVYVREKRPIFLSAEHGDEDQERVLAALRATIAALREGDFLPAGAERPASERRVPATPAQQELFTLAQLGEDASRAYNEGVVLRWRGALDLELLRRVVQRVVDRHEALRATFSPTGEELRIAAEVPVDVPVVDLARAERKAVDRRLAAAVDETFDFFSGPLFRFRLLRCGDGEHLLAATFHHTVVDGLSTDVLLQEIIGSYAAAVRGESLRLPDPQPFGAFVRRQRAWQQGPEMAAAEAYWMAELAGSVPVLELPIDRPRPPWRSHAGRWRQLEIAGPDYQAIRRTATRTGGTLFATLLAAFQTWLYRLTGQRDLIAGAAMAGQAEMGRQPLVGHCVNVLPMRSRIVGDPTFAEFQAGGRSKLAESYEHQHYPFHQLVHKLNLAPDPSRLPLVSALINFESAGSEATIRIGATAIEVTPNRPRGAKFELSLDITAFDERMQIHCSYNSDLFDPTTVGRWLRGFRNLTAGIGERPEQSLRQLPLLDAAERQQLLEWNDTELRRPASCLDRLFAEQVRRTPGAPALVFAGRKLRYAELAARADRLAGWLQDRGSGPNTLVGVSMERSLELVVALYGILRAGAAYVPLDPDHPRERLAFLIADADPPVVLTQEHLASRLPASSAAVVCLDARWPEIDRHRPTRPLAAAAAAADDLAYVIHTSGSTGRPKGVGVSHRAISNRLAWMQRAYGLEAGDRVLQKTPMSFDVSVWEFFWPLAYGARLVLARPGEHRDPAALIALIRAQTITTLHFVPSMLRAFLEHPEAASCTTVRRVVCSGEALPRELEQRFFATLPEAELHNLYGPTEAAVDVTFWACRRGDSRPSVPIGRAIDNVRILLLDAGMVPVPPGVKGELHIGGVGLARGYWRRPGRTAASFVPDPLGHRPGERLYKTGDLARCGADGVVEFLGRSDHQVKIRGMRVELGEIETVLGRHPEVREVAVQALPDAAGGNRLVAWVVPRRPGEMADRELISWIEAELPAYMVPSAFVEIDALPLTRSGKLDRRRLPAPEPTAAADEPFMAPRTEIEGELAKIWRQVLDVERVGVNDSFFRLGGHSLLGTRLMLRIREQLGRELPLRALFEAPTVAGLAARLEEKEQEEPAGKKEDASAERRPAAPPLRPVPRTGPLPLSFAQERMWFLDRLTGSSAAYNIAGGWRLTGNLDAAALAAAVRAVVDRHEALRTRFPAHDDGQPFQVISPPPPRVLAMIDLSALETDRRRSELLRLATREARQPFNLGRGPLLRATLVRLAGREAGLLLTMHHIAADGWSMEIVFKELQVLYQALSTGSEPRLPELPVQYPDFAVWQREWLRGEILDEQVAFWRRHLAELATPELPTDRPRPAVRAFRGDQLAFRLPAPVGRAFYALGRKRNATLFMTVLAAFQTLLFRYTGQGDVVVGSPVANRNHLGLEELIGFFVNTLALRSRLRGGEPFDELLDQVTASALDAFAHQDLPFEKLVEELNPDRDLSRNPLFQVMLVLQNVPVRSSRLATIEVEPLPVQSGRTHFDLQLYLWETGESFDGRLVYDRALFDRTTIRRLAGHFGTLLAAVAGDPGCPLGALPILGTGERQQLLEWNDTAVPRPSVCLHERFRRQAAADPEAVAAVFSDGGQLTRGELEARGNQLARFLKARGRGPEPLIGVAMERSLELVVALVGILKAGAAWVPLDPDHPRQRLESMIGAAGVSLVLTQEHLASRLPAGAATFHLDRQWPEIARLPATAVAAGTRAENLAYVIHTSGSTGRPKGVAVSHRAAGNLLAWLERTLGPTAGERVLQKTPCGFDVSVWEFFWPLVHGHRLVLAPAGAHRDPAALIALVCEHAVTTLHFVPAMLQAFLAHPRAAACTSLRRVLGGGESLPPEVARRFFEVLPGVALHHTYGPTEATVDAASWRCRSGSLPARLPIGRAVDNLRTWVLDGGMRPVPVGGSGELCLGGSSLARGYWCRPARTAAAFVPDPTSRQPGGRLYRTGDRVRFAADGSIEFLGRIDHQVKIRGIRVELGEIEAALRRHSEVSQAAVLAVPDGTGTNRLVACLVPETDAVAAAEELMSWLGARLPAAMVPAFFVVLERLPLTAAGKVDRDALGRRALEAPAAIDVKQSAAPRDPVEAKLAKIWHQLLGVERVGIDDDFFGLGGHSLLATRLISRIRRELDCELPLRAVFEAPTVAGLARRIATAVPGTSRPAIRRVPREKALPLSFAQERMWLLDQLTGGSSIYNLASAWRLIGPLEVPALAAAFSAVIRRHEALRTRFPAPAGQPVQVISPPAPAAMPVIDLTALAAGGRGRESRRLATAEVARPFDLTRGPLLRSTLVRLAGQEASLLVTMHHIVSDGWSIGILLRELTVLYQAAAAGRASPLTPLAIQYADFAAWQRRWLRGEVLDEQLAWWQGQLAGVEPLELPVDRPRPALQAFRGEQLDWRLDEEIVDALQALGQRHGATLFMTLLSAFQILLARTTGQTDVVVGSPVANRNHPEIEDLIGFFVNTLAMRLRLAGDPELPQVLERTAGDALTAYGYQDLPFERLVEHLQPERDLSRNPIFQVVFALQNAPLPAVPMATGVEVRPLAATAATTRFDLELLLWETGGMLVGDLNWDADLFDRSTIERLGDHFRTLLAGIAADAERPLSALPLLAAVERRQLVEEWAGRRTALPAPAMVHGLFAQVAAERPDATALVCGEEALSYAELDARANLLAHRLRDLGVAAEERVALMTERGPEQVVAILAVLKAGGAYVPLDFSYPRERLEWMLADSRPRVLMTGDRFREIGDDVGIRVLDLPPGGEPIAGRSRSEPNARVGEANLAYVMYTSGSTGTPKGVAVTHRSIVRLVRETDFADFGPEDVFLLFAPISFDASTMELWGPLLNGGRLVIPTVEKPSLHELAEMIERYRIGTLWLTAGLFHQMVEAIPAALQPLRQLLAGGDVLSVMHVEKVLRELPEVRLINGYGPTENTTFTCCHTIRRGDSTAGSVPIGRPIANTQVYLLDRYGGPAPRGAVGALAIGGLGLARAYLDRPALTAERFVPDACGSEPGGRLYRTGDLARWDAGGRLLFLGRIDAQVKIRGFRVEPGEIETRLRGCAGVREAAVLALPDPSGNKRLTAYAVPETDLAPAAEELSHELGRQLPPYMVPAFFVFLDSLPLTPNGKLDRNALPAPEEAAAAPTGTAAPRDALEARLLQIWQQVLGIAAIGVDDDFFDLGGHSLLATRMVAEIRQQLAVDLPLRMVFEEPTVAALAASIRERQPAAAPPPIVPVPRDGALPLSFAQQRLWFIDELVPESSFYNIASAWRLVGAVSVPALQRSLDEIVRRHEALRTRFVLTEVEPVQVIEPPAPLPLPRIDLSRLDPAGRRRETDRISSAQAARPFRLPQGQLLRAIFLHLGKDETGLLITMHHIVSDGWSLGLFQQELVALYQAFAAGKPSPLPELAVQYVDFSVWQRRWLTGEVLAELTSWWQRRLAGVATLELPCDRPRPAVQAFRGHRVPVAIAPELTAALRHLCRVHGATPYMTLLAAYQTLLRRSCGQTDVVVGSPIAGRNHPGTEQMIGFFVNALAMRADFSRDPSFRELLGQVRENALDAFAYQDLPFEKLVDQLQIERDLSRNPIFQVVFALQNAEAQMPVRELAELKVLPLYEDASSTRFDLELHLWEKPEALDGMFLFDLDLFDVETVVRFGERLLILLAGIVADPDRRVSQLPVLTAAEELQMLTGWNDVVADYDAEICLHRLFEARAARRPEAVAVTTTAGVEWSYGELNRRANRLAHRLIALGVGPEVLTGVCLERSPEMIVALLAILKAGGGYVPIDPEYPRERIDFILTDVAAPVVITRSWIAAELTANATALCLDADTVPAADTGAGDERNPPPRCSSQNTAYVIFTSGSTGRPKGVVEQHRPVSNLIEWITGTFEVGPTDRVLLVASLWFDLSVYDVFGLLAVGGSIHVAVDDEVRDPEQLARILDSGTITFWDSAPAALAQLVPFLPAAGQGGPRLRLAFLSGDWIPLTLQPALTKAFPNLRVIGLGGATEATVWSNFHPIVEVRPEWVSVPYGRAIQNARYFVLDRWLRPCPLGTPGDLYIGGECLSLGYFGRPQLTAERYLPDPFSRRPGGVLYTTGDRARWRPQGYIEFLGRLDNQVKIRGYRIELGEIEAALIEIAEVEHCVVLAREDVPGNKRLVAWLALGDRPAPDPGELREQLRQRLPSYMAPAVFVALESLPLTVNGKVDRKALRDRALPAEIAEPTSDFVAPKNPTEALLAWVWAQVLDRETVSTEDNFFEVGGDSILSIQVVARAKEAGLKITPQQVFEHQTIAELAAAVAEAAPAPAPEPAGERFALVSLEPAERERLLADLPPVADLMPLSAMQQEMLVHSLAFPQADLNVLQFLRTFAGGLELPLLRRAWQDLVRRHDVLRTAFRWQGVAEPLQLVFAEAEMPWRELDWRSLDADEQRPALRSLLREDRERGFDLAQPPLARLTVIRTADERFALVWTVHHAVIDGWSLALLRQELLDLYAARVAGRDPAPAAVRPYRDYIAWLERQDLDAAEAFWRRSLRDLRAPAPLWIDKLPASGARGDGFDRHTVELEAASSAGLRAYAQSRRLTLATLLQGAWALLLGRYAGDEDVIFGITVSGRPADLEGSATMVGLFINDLPVRIATPPDAPLGPWLRELQDHLARLRQFEYTPQSRIRDWSDVPGNMPLYDTIVVFGNFPAEGAADAAEHEPEVPTEPAEEPYFGVRTSSRLTLISDPSHRLPLSLVFDRRFFERTTAARMLHHLRTLAEGLVAASDQRPLADLPLLTAAERHQLVTGPATVDSDHRALQELLAARLAHRPGARKPRPLRLDAKTRIDLLDARGRPVPLGVPGAAWLSGGRMNRSVLGRLGARCEKLVPGPLGGAAGERFYRTGELARRLADGSVEWLGRLDRATRAGTRTLLPGVVEAALERRPDVREAAVLAVENRPGEVRPEACVIAAGPETPTVGRLHRDLEDRLPRHLLPAEWYVVPADAEAALPRTEAGEIDEQALGEMRAAGPWDRLTQYTRDRLYQDSVEAQLARIWSELFNLRQVDADEDFFALGGSSVLAVSLVARIRDRLGVELPLAALLAGSTVRQLAQVVREQAADLPWSPLVKIKPDGSRPPFFCVHAAGGNVVGFNDLVRQVEREQPFYGLQSVGLDGREEPYDRIDEMAARYVEEIQTVDGHGPYALGGLSFGGYVAFEMACRLREQGREVALLVLFDAWSPIFHDRLVLAESTLDQEEILAVLVNRTAGLYGSDFSLSRDEIAACEPQRQIDHAVEQLYAAGVDPGIGPDQVRRLLEIHLSTVRATNTWIPKHYPGRVTLFCAVVPDLQLMEVNRHPGQGRPELYEGWRKLTDELEIFDVPGDHGTMLLEPHVRELARHFNACLRRNQEK